MVVRYTPGHDTAQIMAAEKTVSVSFRVSPTFKAMLEAAAARENRSQTNLLETLLMRHCELYGIAALPPKPAGKTRARPKGVAS